MKRTYGNVATGDRFWDRKADLALLIQRIDDGQHVLLVAQRRMGKTSLMKEAMARLKDRYTCLFIDLQKAASSADVIVELSLATRPFKSLWDKSKDVFSNILSRLSESIEEVSVNELGVKLRAGLTNANWAEKGDQLFAILATSEKPVFLCVDEISIFLNRILKDDEGTVTSDGRREVEQFMSWLRENSIRHQGSVRMILSGSIGLEPVLNQAGLSATVNTFGPFELNPWDVETAQGCLDALAQEYGVVFHPGATHEMTKQLGCCIPHHVQMFFSHVYDRCVRRNRMDFFTDEVEAVYNEEMLSIQGHAELTHYEERLKLVLGPQRFTIALELLTEAAVVGRLPKDALRIQRDLNRFPDIDLIKAQREILEILQHDGYLRESNGEFQYISKLLRDWWRKRYEAFYTPLAERTI